MSFDSLFGLVLVFGKNLSIYTNVLSICSFLTLSKPSKHIIIVINSIFSVFKDQNIGFYTLLPKVQPGVPKCQTVGHSMEKYKIVL